MPKKFKKWSSGIITGKSDFPLGIEGYKKPSEVAVGDKIQDSEISIVEIFMEHGVRKARLSDGTTGKIAKIAVG